MASHCLSKRYAVPAEIQNPLSRWESLPPAHQTLMANQLSAWALPNRRLPNKLRHSIEMKTGSVGLFIEAVIPA